MKWNKIGRGVMATVLSAAIALGATACSRDYVVAYLYATASTLTSDGDVLGYQVDYQLGTLVQLANSPTPTQGRNPVGLVASPNGKYLYVIHRDDSNVVEFAIGTDGKLYPQHTYPVIGSFPQAVAIDPLGKFLYIVSTYQPGYTTARPGPGNITVFPIAGDNSLGTATSVNIGNNPVGIVASNQVCVTAGTVAIPGNAVCASANGTPGVLQNQVYVLDRETTTSIAGNPVGTGNVLVYWENSTNGALVPVTAGVDPTLGGYKIGVTPTALAVDPTARFLYVTDQGTNQIFGSAIQNTGALVQLTNSPFPTGDYPINLTIEPRGKYLYVVNFNAGNVQAFVIDQGNGTLSGAVATGSTATETNPTCVSVEPALGKYLYTSNRTAGSISGFQLDSHNGVLTQVQGAVFNAQPLPTCLVTVANGSHATQLNP